MEIDMPAKLITAALISLSIAAPVNAGPVATAQFRLADDEHPITKVAGKRKKNKHGQRTPKAGDVLIGPVEGFHRPDFSQGRRVREGSDLGGLIGEAVNTFMGGGLSSGAGSRGRTTGSHQIPIGGYGQNCGPQYGTRNPTSPAC
jgi:hypothetical protein